MEMALSAANVRCSDLERQLENVRAELVMQKLKTSQDGELEKREEKLPSHLQLEAELTRTNKQLEDVKAELLKSGDRLQKQWLKAFQNGELEKQEKQELKRELNRFENEMDEQKQVQTRMQVCFDEMQMELCKTYQEKKELEKQKEQHDEMTIESNAKVMNLQKQLDAMKNELDESQEEVKRLPKYVIENKIQRLLRDVDAMKKELDESYGFEKSIIRQFEENRVEKEEIGRRVETLSQRLVEVVECGKKLEEELHEMQQSLNKNLMQMKAAQTELAAQTDLQEVLTEFLREKQGLTKQLDEFTSNLARKEQDAQKERDEISAGRVKTPSHRLVVECGKKLEVELQTNKTEISVVRSVSSHTENTRQRGLHDLDAMKELDESYYFQKSFMRQIEETGAARAAAEYSLLFL